MHSNSVQFVIKSNSADIQTAVKKLNLLSNDETCKAFPLGCSAFIIACIMVRFRSCVVEQIHAMSLEKQKHARRRALMAYL